MSDAQSLTQHLLGKWYGRFGVAPCPVCQPEGRLDQNALTLSNGFGGRLLLHCKKRGCDFRELAAALGLRPGSFAAPDPVETTRQKAAAAAEIEKRARLAEAIWRQSGPIIGTHAEAYLRGRGITCDLSTSLRFHPKCWHQATARRLPALVALVEGGERWAVHRTWLQPDGTGKATVEPQKAMLGATAGGAVRLQEGAGRFVVAEGIETALSLACGLLTGPMTLLAALSTSGIRRLRLPDQPSSLSIATDGDAAGRSAGYALAERAAALGWAVSIFSAPDGKDWNDVLQTKKGAAP